MYAKPDVLRKGRVLAALAKDGTIFVPLRSMFEQMGAAVSYDPDSKIATVSKPGAQIVVTVGKAEVVINGETRPLDVPPIVYNGVVMVPIRVISETMGAYVQWVPDRHLVVVRYVPAVPPTAAPTRGAGRSGYGASDPPHAESVHPARVLPLVLLHAAERLEQSGHAVQLLARRKVQL